MGRLEKQVNKTSLGSRRVTPGSPETKRTEFEEIGIENEARPWMSRLIPLQLWPCVSITHVVTLSERYIGWDNDRMHMGSQGDAIDRGKRGRATISG
jgi:hypothetical protein